ncbi:MAG: hypothetical protein JO336_04660 [Acidobacteriia bacterium]|nr:hypothetical protein [Terriglobia bacterium]MBV9744132.1 hypothetical protein [Terriglobia bacterium]
MPGLLRLAPILVLFCSAGFADSWSGALVNSHCYNSLERNHNPHDTLGYVDRDRYSEIQYCSPNTKTKSFELVTDDGQALKFDAAGNAQAAALVQKTGKQALWKVNVTGEPAKNVLKVDSISLAQ